MPHGEGGRSLLRQFAGAPVRTEDALNVLVSYEKYAATDDKAGAGEDYRLPCF